MTIYLRVIVGHLLEYLLRIRLKLKIGLVNPQKKNP